MVMTDIFHHLTLNPVDILDPHGFSDGRCCDASVDAWLQTTGQDSDPIMLAYADSAELLIELFLTHVGLRLPPWMLFRVCRVHTAGNPLRLLPPSDLGFARTVEEWEESARMILSDIGALTLTPDQILAACEACFPWRSRDWNSLYSALRAGVVPGPQGKHAPHISGTTVGSEEDPTRPNKQMPCIGPHGPLTCTHPLLLERTRCARFVDMIAARANGGPRLAIAASLLDGAWVDMEQLLTVAAALEV